MLCNFFIGFRAYLCTNVKIHSQNKIFKNENKTTFSHVSGIPDDDGLC